MCPYCNSCSKKSEKELPENELWLLFRAAYEQYKSEILNGEKAYSRYVNDFFSYHLPVVSMNEADTRLHVMHVCAVKEMLEHMASTLAQGERIEIRGFGSFSLHYRAPRTGRNPKTGDKVELEAAPENKAITEFETKEKPKRQYNKK